MANAPERDAAPTRRLAVWPVLVMLTAALLAEIAVWAAVRAAYPIGWPIDHMPVGLLSLENAPTVAFVIASPVLVFGIAATTAPRRGDTSRLVRGLVAASVFGAWLALVTALRIDLIGEPLWIALIAGGAAVILAVLPRLVNAPGDRA